MDPRTGVTPPLGLLVQCHDDVLQVMQREVDVLGLVQHPPIRPGLGHSLGTSQVHQIQLRPTEQQSHTMCECTRMQGWLLWRK